MAIYQQRIRDVLRNDAALVRPNFIPFFDQVDAFSLGRRIRLDYPKGLSALDSPKLIKELFKLFLLFRQHKSVRDNVKILFAKPLLHFENVDA